MAISREQVIAAARALRDEGIEPTYARVREVLGSGSFSTIARALRDLHTEEQAGSPEPGDEMPEAFAAIGRDVARRAWAAAREWGREQAEAERRAAEGRAAEATELLALAEAEIERLQAGLAAALAEAAHATLALAESVRAEAEARGALAEAQRIEQLLSQIAARSSAPDGEVNRGQDPSTATGRPPTSGGRRRKKAPEA